MRHALRYNVGPQSVKKYLFPPSARLQDPRRLPDQLGAGDRGWSRRRHRAGDAPPSALGGRGIGYGPAVPHEVATGFVTGLLPGDCVVGMNGKDRRDKGPGGSD